ncbi:hypothetical protein F5J12DRAFT_904177 [Pisolithus orientalis]|uniref:uncharacterized protein n=1 Tax=Pisolithus orientalis TaxID=936130 RepID=UPI002224DCB0|nr:uncharacterized protein F5J12DRAFT_904177 [Pisolithus orientalis]KAI6019777.1 hypothetical protein F5J12DRAFT_904177 [Pisolithus orientalis]
MNSTLDQSDCVGVPASHASKPLGTPKTILVVGLGMVGIAFIEKILNLDEAKHYRVVTCGEETHLAYNRVALTEYFQHRSVEKLYLNQVEWYARQDPEHFVFYTGEQVTSMNTAAHFVKTSKGRLINYDYCVLATGSESTLPPYIPPERVAQTKGVFVYRNISDLDKILSYSEENHVRGGRAVVVGGGLLGLEAAKAVFDLETIGKVTIINRQAYPLSRQLDDEGGEIVLRCIEAMGVEVLTKTSVTSLVTTPEGVLTGLVLSNDDQLDAEMVVYAIGISPRDDLARKAGLKCGVRGGITVDDYLRTSIPDIYAIGECASWRENTFGLIGPGVEMADILAFNLTQVQTDVGGFKPRQMNMPDLSTKLKLMGVDVASFGDYFLDKRVPRGTATRSRKVEDTQADKLSRAGSAQDGKPAWEIKIDDSNASTTPASNKQHILKSDNSKRHGSGSNEPIECLTYRDPFSFVYKKYIFTADGKHLLGGMMVGDTSDYVKLISLVKKKKAIDVPPSQFIVGVGKKGEDDGADLDDDTQVCSCHNVTKGAIVACDLKCKTKVGTGCGGCMPLVTNLFKSEMKKAGHAVSNNLCTHFTMSRQELFTVIKLRKLRTFPEVMQSAGAKPDSVGCELCRPAVASILSSMYNELVVAPSHHSNQDTNDSCSFMLLLVSLGTFSVVPRVAGGEITPDKLIVLGQVAKKCTQRIDLFGAQKQDLPDIWEELVNAGFESGHAYGKALRTVKSCVGTTWCRYGVGDSVGMAIRLEERYKGIRSPHKLKGGVSGCTRECAEAQSKDFGLIATDKGWNIFLAGNGGTNPRHATLFAKDVPPSKVIRILDRFLMYYIRTADKLMRTARWVEQFEGGIERLQKILLDDELGICDELEAEMATLVGTYHDEWSVVVKDPARRRQFRQFVNTSEWKWRKLATVQDLELSDTTSSSVAVKYGDSQLAIFHVPKKGFFATQQMCPHKRAFVLDHGIVGDDKQGDIYVSCPLHKRNFRLSDGTCLNDMHPEELDAVIGTSKWMIKQATAEILSRGGGQGIEIAADHLDGPPAATTGAGCNGDSCGDSTLDW